MDPLSLASLITTCVIGGITLIVNVWQSIKFDHFKLNCSDCCSLDIENDSDAEPKKK